jgi:penicillin V acylase-like amidase (Ntn superfamily)
MAGLAANALYLAETDYGDAAASGSPLRSVGGWTQYILDSYASVAEAVDALSQEKFAIVSSTLPNGKPAGGHLALADPSGDSDPRVPRGQAGHSPRNGDDKLPHVRSAARNRYPLE